MDSEHVRSSTDCSNDLASSFMTTEDLSQMFILKEISRERINFIYELTSATFMVPGPPGMMTASKSCSSTSLKRASGVMTVPRAHLKVLSFNKLATVT